MQHITNANYPGQVIHGAYYPHIDGIRAFAVLPVVLFHVLACMCPGGYAGVDVFFVISGYLITGGILRDLARDRFTIRDFYHRRIRRILPAYFAVVAAVFVFGCAVYHALPLMQLADATIMGSLFVANQYLWNIGGDYFTPDIHTNPLLHLWSLSVEEQFYLFIPVIGLVVWKYRRRWLLPVLVGLAVFSLGWALYAMASGKQVMAFYVLPMRAWELLAGSLLAMVPGAGVSGSTVHGSAVDSSTPKTMKPWNLETLKRFISAIGLLLVLLPYVLYSQKTPFPGATALPSVVGTALLIRYGAGGWAGWMLAWRPLVIVGKMSYSLYLWHWPVTVYWKYMVYDQLYVWDYVGMLALSFLLAFLSWRFVEIPVRTSQRWTMRRSFVFAGAGIVLLVGVGVMCVFNKGWPSVLHPKANEMLATDDIKPQFVERLVREKIKRAGHAFGRQSTSQEVPVFFRNAKENFPLGGGGLADVLLIGDSHACALQYGLDITLREQGRAGRSLIRCGKIVYDLNKNECREVLAELSRQPQVTKVILTEFWKPCMEGDANSYARLEEFACRIKAMGKTLFVVADIPCYTFSPVDRLAKEKIVGPRRLPTDDYVRQSFFAYGQAQGEVNRRMEAICKKTGAVFIPMFMAFKEEDAFVSVEKVGTGRVSLYRDDHHLSQAGSLRAARFLMPYLFPEALGVAD